MYKIIPWTPDVDIKLTEFYAEASRRGFVNNASRKMLVESIARERKWVVWILFYNDEPVGSVAAHSFDEMGPDSYRIAARTCVFTDKLPQTTLRTRNQIVTHQHVTSQFLIPACIEWAPAGSSLYITSNDSSVGTQRLVHRIFGPAMEETGQMRKIKDMFYRGENQTVWQLYPDKFMEELGRYPRW
jgi:hypothetical protein